MTVEEFQKIHGFDDESVERIRMALLIFKGKIVSITENNAKKGHPSANKGHSSMGKGLSR